MNGSLTGCFFDFVEERDQCELDFEAVKRVKLGEEHCWDTMEKGNQVSVEERKQEAGAWHGKAPSVEENLENL